MQGRLRGEPLEVVIETQCAHCSRELRMSVDSELRYRVLSEGAEPLVLEPHVDWQRFTAPNIIDDY